MTNAPAAAGGGAARRTFPPLRFRGTLRPAQAEVLERARRDLAAGGRQIHVVAPPGSGKTVVGLALWAELVRRPALVLSPNSAIQAQWAARLDLFEGGDAPGIASTDPDRPAWLTSLTYQALATTRGGADLDAEARRRWAEQLVARGDAADEIEAGVWIDDLARHNAPLHERRLAGYRKQAREALAAESGPLAVLHPAARALVERLGAHGLGLVVLDECHHLLAHWGRVLDALTGLFADAVVVGLTATPPDREESDPEDVARYDRLFGAVDYEVPVPALVRDGFLAPYQDLAYFVRPTPEELAFVAGAEGELRQLVDELCGTATSPSLVAWVEAALAAPSRRDGALADAGPRFLAWRAAAAGSSTVALDLDAVVPVLDRFVRHHLERSPDPGHHALAERVGARLRLYGVQLTEAGPRACASPIGRVLAYSRAKAGALVPILVAEHAALGDRLRAVVVADYEKTSSVTTEVTHLLDAEAGGAVAAFRTLVGDPRTDALDPILVTGSTVLVDDDLAPRVLDECQAWLAAQGFDVTLTLGHEADLAVLLADGADWSPRVYVRLLTELFQRGVTRCIVGTRGLLGEGWDATKVNVLVDLTTVTTATSVHQLRGRSLRLDPDDPAKVADNWDVVCLAPELAKGLDDYARFRAKHRVLYGATEDGAIEKGVGHVHAAFTEIAPEGVEEAAQPLVAEMLRRVAERDRARARWRIGEPYRGATAHALEGRGIAGGGGGFPPFVGSRAVWTDATLAAAVGRAVLGALSETGRLTRAHAPDALTVAERSGGYVRTFLAGADAADARRYADAVREVLGPVDGARWVIPRAVDLARDTWISRMLPELFARYFRRRDRVVERLHAVPSVLAASKDDARVFERHWNAHVSPGEAVYALAGRGADLVLAAGSEGAAAVPPVLHEKQIFT